MPAIRTLGIAPECWVECTVVTDAGEEVGYERVQTRFYLAVDGHLEQLGFPIPIEHPAPDDEDPIDDLYGVPATLSCEVWDDEDRRSSATIPVVLSEG